MVTSQDAHEKAKDIIRGGLETQFQGKVSFNEIRITPRSGDGDEEYLDVQVIYDGRRADLKPRLLNSLYATIEHDLRAIGIEKIPAISYREKTEDSGWAQTAQTSSPGDLG